MKMRSDNISLEVPYQYDDFYTQPIVNGLNKLTSREMVIANEVKQSHEIAASLRSSQ
jgi:hypothetical protein